MNTRSHDTTASGFLNIPSPWIIGIAVALILATGIFWWHSRQNPSEEPPGDVQYVTVRQGRLQTTVIAAGTISPFRQTEVKSRASGRITKLFVRDGDWVKPGQRLLELDEADEKNNLNRTLAGLSAAKAELMASRVALRAAKRAEHQQNVLVSTQMAPTESVVAARESVQRLESAYRVQAAAVTQQKIAVAVAKRQFDDTKINAPIGGLILSQNVQEGQIIASGISSNSGGTALFTIGDMSRRIIKAEIDEVDIGKLTLGQPCITEVDAYPGKHFQGTLTHIAPSGKETTSVTTFPIEITITDPDSRLLKPGMTTSTEITTHTYSNKILMPSSALHTGRTGPWVWRLDPKGKWIRHPISIGPQNDTDVIVTAGLSAGDKAYIRQESPGSRATMPGQFNTRQVMRTGRAMGR